MLRDPVNSHIKWVIHFEENKLKEVEIFPSRKLKELGDVFSSQEKPLPEIKKEERLQNLEKVVRDFHKLIQELKKAAKEEKRDVSSKENITNFADKLNNFCQFILKLSNLMKDDDKEDTL